MVRGASYADRTVGQQPVSIAAATATDCRRTSRALRIANGRRSVAIGPKPLAAMVDILPSPACGRGKSKLPSPFGRGAGGEGSCDCKLQ